MKSSVRLLRLLVDVVDLAMRLPNHTNNRTAPKDNASDKLASERLRGRVEYWKQVVAIQMHFNDMCIRTRWLGLTAIGTLMAAAAVAEKENVEFGIPFWVGHQISLPTVLIAISFMVLTATWALDGHYYYKMLIAAVEYGETLEHHMVQDDLQLPDDGVTAYISKSVSRRRAAFASRSFYLIVGGMVVLFLVGSLLPHVPQAP